MITWSLLETRSFWKNVYFLCYNFLDNIELSKGLDIFGSHESTQPDFYGARDQLFMEINELVRELRKIWNKPNNINLWRTWFPVKRKEDLMFNLVGKHISLIGPLDLNQLNNLNSYFLRSWLLHFCRKLDHYQVPESGKGAEAGLIYSHSIL